MHLFIVRHGECLGQCDPAAGNDPDTDLSALGEWQARQAAERLGAEGVGHVLSSPLTRALGTASLIAEAAGIAAIDVWLELREGWLGDYHSHPRAELLRRFPQAVLPPSMMASGWTHTDDATYEQFLARALSTLRRIQNTYASEDRLVIVTHGGFANCLLHAILQIPPAAPQWFELANASLSHIRLVPDPQKERPNWLLYPPVTAEVFSINDVAHLK